MKQQTVFSILLFSLLLTACVLFNISCSAQNTSLDGTTISLPSPTFDSKVTVEQAIKARRSIRSFSNVPLTLNQVSNILWAAQGITDPATGHRAAPSAMAVYPLEVYLVAGNVSGLPAGVYHYVPRGHKLVLVTSGDQRANISGQGAVNEAPATIAITAVYDRFKGRSTDKAQLWAALETGHVAENVCLEAVALGLSTVPVGGLDEAQMTKALHLSKDYTPLYLLPVGTKR